MGEKLFYVKVQMVDGNEYTINGEPMENLIDKDVFKKLVKHLLEWTTAEVKEGGHILTDKIVRVYIKRA